MNRMRSWVLVLTAVHLGCSAARISPVSRHPLPPELAGYYDYAPVALTSAVERTEQRSGYTFQRLRLSGPLEKLAESILVDWYRPSRPGRLPAVLMSPILADNDLYVREFARHYAARGLHTVLVYRRKEIFSAGRPLSDVEEHLQESILDLRRVIDWLETQESVDAGRIGSFAISMGAILTSILAAVEPRIRCSVLGLAAGRIPEILMTSQDKGIAKRRNNYLRENNRTAEETRGELRRVIVSEPLRFAPTVDSKRILMIAGLFDRVLGLQRSLELWRAMGKPRLILLPTGHYTAALATPSLKIVTYSFLKRSLRSTSR